MSQSLTNLGDAARPRFRGIITTPLMILLAVMIVRDILARRGSSEPPPSPDVTRRVP